LTGDEPVEELLDDDEEELEDVEFTVDELAEPEVDETPWVVTRGPVDELGAVEPAEVVPADVDPADVDPADVDPADVLLGWFSVVPVVPAALEDDVLLRCSVVPAVPVVVVVEVAVADSVEDEDVEFPDVVVVELPVLVMLPVDVRLPVLVTLAP